MPLPKAAVLASTASLLRNNDWEFRQTQAPVAGPGALSETLRARINAKELPKSDETTITDKIAGYTIVQSGRHTTHGTITITVYEAIDGEASGYFEALKALNHPRNSAGQITGSQINETDKEGEYIFALKGTDDTVVKKYTIKHAVVTDVSAPTLASGEDAEFVSFDVKLQYKDHTVQDANGHYIA